jgi:MFS family permease
VEDGTSSTTLAGAVDAARPGQVKRIAWLHFANDLSLDFLTPLLPSVVGAAWVGLMEGLADGIGQVLKLASGRMSDRSGQRARWVRSGYLINAVARPLSAIGLLFAWPVWVIACRVVDRIGKGIRGSATDALVADWSEGDARSSAFARMRTMDHLGATIGGLGAALAAWTLPPGMLWIAVAGLACVTCFVLMIARGLRDSPVLAPSGTAAGVSGWWPRSPALRWPLFALAVAALATRISPLLILVLVSGSYGHATAPWPLWCTCLAWAALGLIQSGASAMSEPVIKRIGPSGLLRLSLIAATGIFAALALTSGVWLVVTGIAFGAVTGLNDGIEKTWLATIAPKSERALAYGALALLIAGAGIIGNSVCGLLLAHLGQQVFWIFAVSAAVACLLIGHAARRHA